MTADAVGGLLRPQRDHLAVDRLFVSIHRSQSPLGKPQLLHQGDIAMAATAQRDDFLGRSRCLTAQPVHDMVISLCHPFSLMAVQTAIEGFAVVDRFNPLVKGVQMTILAIRIGFLHQRRIAGFDRMNAGFKYIDDFSVGKILLGKRRFDMADIAAIDLLRHRIVGKLFYVGVASPAGHLAVQAVQKDMLVDIIVFHMAVCTDPSQIRIFMTHEAVFLVRGLRL